MGLILQEAGGMRMIFRHPARQLTSSAKASEVILNRLMSSTLASKFAEAAWSQDRSFCAVYYLRTF